MRHNKVAKSIGEMSELGYVDVCVADGQPLTMYWKSIG